MLIYIPLYVLHQNNNNTKNQNNARLKHTGNFHDPLIFEIVLAVITLPKRKKSEKIKMDFNLKEKRNVRFLPKKTDDRKLSRQRTTKQAPDKI